MDWKLSSF